ncbi:SEP-domain-containing protein [Diplocarpon rosae]|nr:SEP-domain-containing protein [Diplocarpon rosae]
MADRDNQDDLVSQFVDLTGASAADAQQYLTANRWDLSGAAAEYFTALEEGTAGAQEGEAAPEEPYTGPRTLDGRPAPQSIPTAGSSSSALPKKRGGIATLGSLGQGSAGAHAGHGHAHGDEDDSEDDDDAEQPRDLFAGGEKSGLAVQDPSANRNDPRKVVNDILKKARANASRPGGEPSPAAPSRFRGSGMTLGGDDTPSQVVPDPNPQAAEPGPTQTRILHLWEDGFSVEDGPLRRFDDPQNASDLQMIRTGRAPLHLMGVRPDQPVDVQLVKHEGAYVAQPKVYKPFSGSGNRLGSPVPGASSSSSSAVPASSMIPTAPSSSAPAEPQIDASQPTLALRVQLASGTRLSARFNTTSTIGDVYDFVDHAAPAGDRPWVLATTFPNKNHTDKSLILGEMAEFKRGGTAVQKWI